MTRITTCEGDTNCKKKRIKNEDSKTLPDWKTLSLVCGNVNFVGVWFTLSRFSEGREHLSVRRSPPHTSSDRGQLSLNVFSQHSHLCNEVYAIPSASLTALDWIAPPISVPVWSDYLTAKEEGKRCLNTLGPRMTRKATVMDSGGVSTTARLWC